MVDTASVRPSADVKNVGQEVEKQVKVRDGWLPVIVSHVLSPDEIYVQNAAPSTQTFLHRFTACHLLSSTNYINLCHI